MDTQCLEIGSGLVQYSEAGESRSGQVLFVHGAPGSSRDWAECLKTAASDLGLRAAAIDRIGYGSVNRGKRGDTTRFSFQAQALGEFIRAWARGAPLYLVGHSYGAPLVAATSLGLAAEGSVAGVVLVSGVLQPSRNHTRWYHRLALLRLLGPFLLVRYRRASAEMRDLRATLLELAAEWDEFSIPFALVHGEQDGLIPPCNSLFAQRRLGQNSIHFALIDGAAHRLPQSHPREVCRALQSLLVAETAAELTRRVVL